MFVSVEGENIVIKNCI